MNPRLPLIEYLHENSSDSNFVDQIVSIVNVSLDFLFDKNRSNLKDIFV